MQESCSRNLMCDHCVHCPHFKLTYLVSPRSLEGTFLILCVAEFRSLSEVVAQVFSRCSPSPPLRVRARRAVCGTRVCVSTPVSASPRPSPCRMPRPKVTCDRARPLASRSRSGRVRSATFSLCSLCAHVTWVVALHLLCTAPASLLTTSTSRAGRYLQPLDSDNRPQRIGSFTDTIHLTRHLPASSTRISNDASGTLMHEAPASAC